MASPTTATRSSTMNTTGSDHAIPPETGEIGTLLVERLRAWKHAVGYLEAYVSQTESLHKTLAKEYQKVLKTVDEPLREGHHFDQTIGGVASFFENVRANTVGLSNSHTETATALKSTVLPILERLHKEIKDRSKHVQSECERAAKAVAKTRNTTQTQIELLGQHATAFGSAGGASAHGHTGGLHLHHTNSGGKPRPESDPYLLKKGVLQRLQKQVQEENTQQSDLIGVQEHFNKFEEHVVQTVQHALTEMNTVLAGTREKEQSLYADMTAKANAIPPDFEWVNFTVRNASTLIPPDAPKRTVESITFPNQTHPSTEPLISGALQRKGKIMRSYNSAYYVITPTKYLHEFRDTDTSNTSPEPEMSLYLPECTISALNSEGKFQISGKDAGSKLGTKHDYAFKASSPSDGRRWHEIVTKCSGLATNESPIATPMSPNPPAYSRHNTQESGVTTVQNGGTPPLAAVVEKDKPAGGKVA